MLDIFNDNLQAQHPFHLVNRIDKDAFEDFMQVCTWQDNLFWISSVIIFILFGQCNRLNTVLKVTQSASDKFIAVASGNLPVSIYELPSPCVGLGFQFADAVFLFVKSDI